MRWASGFRQRIGFFLLTLCGAAGLHAQVVTVELHGGYRVFGELLALERGSHLELALFDGDTLRIDYADYYAHRVHRRVYTSDYRDSEYTGYRRTAPFYFEGSFGLVRTSYIYSSGRRNNYLEAQGMLGVGRNLSARSSLGLAVATSYNGGQEWAFYLDYRTKLWDAPSALQAQLRAGFSSNIGAVYDPFSSRGTSLYGLAFYPELTYVHRGHRRWGWLIGAGVRVSRREFSYFDPRTGRDVRVPPRMNGRIAVRIGVLF